MHVVRTHNSPLGKTGFDRGIFDEEQRIWSSSVGSPKLQRAQLEVFYRAQPNTNLRELLFLRSLPRSGNKTTLVSRLVEHVCHFEEGTSLTTQSTPFSTVGHAVALAVQSVVLASSSLERAYLSSQLNGISVENTEMARRAIVLATAPLINLHLSVDEEFAFLDGGGRRLRDHYRRLSMPDLKQLLRHRKLRLGGRKAELVERLSSRVEEAAAC